jgi:dihydropteroate synthase
MLVAPGVSAPWRTARGALHLDRPVVVGILNITPDSFYDGGRYQSVEAAVRHAERLLTDGADVLDVGGESTRPGAVAVGEGDETRRVVPVIDALVRRFPDVVISVDTVKSAVASAALDAGAAIINDVSGLRLDDELGSVVARSGAGLIIMHSRGTIETMARYELANYSGDVAGDVAAELADAIQRARRAGVSDDALVVDPGLGFSKRTEHSLEILAHLKTILALGLPVLVGPSRKRFIGDAAGGLQAADRLPGTIAACVLALAAGARLFRVHDVAELRRALDFAWAAGTAESH